jgi:hypothetical protein
LSFIAAYASACNDPEKPRPTRPTRIFFIKVS